MSIEVKQMIVKTSIVHHASSDERNPAYRSHKLAASETGRIMDMCRRLVTEMLADRRER